MTVIDSHAIQPPGPPKGDVKPASNTTVGGTAGRTAVDVTMPATYENADAVFKGGHYPEAAEMFEKYVASNPNNAFGFYMLGLSSWKAGDFDRAEEAFDKSIDLNPAFAKSYFNQARVLLDLKRAPEALEQIEKGLGIDSTSSDGWRLKARAQAASGDMDGAMKTYQTLLVRADEDLWGLNNLGVLMLDTRRLRGRAGSAGAGGAAQAHVAAVPEQLRHGARAVGIPRGGAARLRDRRARRLRLHEGGEERGAAARHRHRQHGQG